MPLIQPQRSRRSKKFGAGNSEQSTTLKPWRGAADRIHANPSAGDERFLIRRLHTVSSREMRDLYQCLEEAQQLAGLGNWSFDQTLHSGRWSEQCLQIFGLPAGAAGPSYQQLLRRILREDRADFIDRIKRAVRTGQPFETEFRLRALNDEIRWVRTIARPVSDSNGQLVRLHGTVMDVTQRKLTELRQSMEHIITRLLAEADEPLLAIPDVIQTICETLGWCCGALWLVERQSGALQRQATWSVARPRIVNFFQISKDFIDTPIASGLIGRTLNAAAPIWNEDVAEDQCFLRGDAARAAKLHAAFAFPIQAGGEIIGLMEFFTEQRCKADADMLQSAHFIGRHIGQFFQRRQAEDALRESEAHFRAVVEQASDSFYMHDADGRIIDVNQHGCDCLGYSRQELLGMTVADINVDLSIGELKHLHQQLTTRPPVALEGRHRRKDGTVFPVEIRMGPILIDGSRHLLALVRDVTERTEMQAHIQHLAYHDALTNLPNRAMFNRNLGRAITYAQRHHKRFGLLFIDLDRFKNINDTLGHNAGDRLLTEMARRLSACVIGDANNEETGACRNMVARLGGDEFVVLIEEVSDIGAVGKFARRILAALVKEYALDGQLIHVTASIGISMFPDDGRNEFSLMKHADIAMYRAKDKGKNNFQFYSAQMDLHSTKLLTLESNLRRAVEKREFVLYYQAKVEARTRRITGVEALVRWQHPEFGLVAPAHFIPLAEESGLIVPLSTWVLQEACRQHRAWQQQGLPPLLMAVNLSARQFVDDNLLLDTTRALRQNDMNPALLELEITESMMMHNTEKTIHVLSALRELGIRIAIDDFGIGYSSLSHLKQFPIDIIKIDRSFIKDIPGDHADEAITDAIIAMAKSLKLKVVAEGVETGAQLEFLSQRTCHEIQGYFFSRPVPADDFVELLRKNLVTSAALVVN